MFGTKTFKYKKEGKFIEIALDHQKKKILQCPHNHPLIPAAKDTHQKQMKEILSKTICINKKNLF